MSVFDSVCQRIAKFSKMLPNTTNDCVVQYWQYLAEGHLTGLDSRDTYPCVSLYGAVLPVLSGLGWHWQYLEEGVLYQRGKFIHGHTGGVIWKN